MPKDKKGNFHMNAQRAMAADKAPPPAHKAPAAVDEMHPGADADPMAGGEHSTIHAGLQAAHAESGGKHMHVQHDGMSLKSHHTDESGQPQGPHDHDNLEALKQHMDQYFSEEQNEY